MMTGLAGSGGCRGGDFEFILHILVILQVENVVNTQGAQSAFSWAKRGLTPGF
jgi:hypothetical protein